MTGQKVVHFIIPGLPVGKGSVRSGTHTYTDTKTRNYMKRAREEYNRQVGYVFPEDTPLEIVIVAYYQIASSDSKKKKALKRSGEIVPVVKPDWDNIAKAVCDSLQPDRKSKGAAAFKDDSRIVIGTVVKRYSDNPRVEVWLREWNKNTENEIWFS